MLKRRENSCCRADYNTLLALVVVLLCLLVSCAVWITFRHLRKRPHPNSWDPYQPWDIVPLSSQAWKTEKDVEYMGWGPFVPCIVDGSHLSQGGRCTEFNPKVNEDNASSPKGEGHYKPPEPVYMPTIFFYR
ncbi:hypothetical protein Hypma_014309 [Hypsizygus marmoreus]|uniref:Uncharacterized protein n=1 Tax=Hypsizygus marmoreus TaxID=39966 RepID=A0A369JAG3_HYPMA|nr:hypothetical protein Hypma_014309 [Hypsizygus marmoreus]